MVYGVKISKTKAFNFFNKLPKIGYQFFIKRIDNNDLYLSNVSGNYYLQCASIPDNNLLDYFNIK